MQADKQTDAPRLSPPLSLYLSRRLRRHWSPCLYSWASR